MIQIFLKKYSGNFRIRNNNGDLALDSLTDKGKEELNLQVTAWQKALQQLQDQSDQ